MRHNDPVGYLITFTCYGTRVHGDERGSVHHDDTRFTFPKVVPDPEVEKVMRQRMVQEPFTLDAKARFIVNKTTREVFKHREWNLGRLNVRSNHVHIAAAVKCTPEKVMGDVKAWCTRRLREKGLIARDRRVWADGGSTIYLWNRDSWFDAINYVGNQQGPDLPMAEC